MSVSTNFYDVQKWSNLVDELEDQLLDRDIEVPNFEGDAWTDPLGRIWRRVNVSHGKVGGRWCYWNADHSAVVADSIFNGGSPHFAGLLRIPYDGVVQTSLMIETL